MDVTISWESDAKSVLRYTFEGAWDWHDLYAAFELHIDLCHENKTCILIDLRQASNIPSDAVLHLQRAAEMVQSVPGKIVIIASSSPAVTMFRLFVTIYHSVGDKVSLASSNEEAYQILGLTT